MAWLWVWLSPVEMCVSQLLKLPGATLGSGDQLKEKSLHLCVRTTGRPGNLGASCWVEPMSNANSWRAPGYVCACMPTTAAGLQALKICQQLRAAQTPGHGENCRMAGLRSGGIHRVHVCFPLTGSS